MAGLPSARRVKLDTAPLGLVGREYPKTPEMEYLPPDVPCREGEAGVKLGWAGSTFVADVGLAGLCSAGKDIRLAEVGEVIVSVGSVLGNGTDRMGTPSIDFCLGGGSEGEPMGIVVHSGGFVLGVGREAETLSEERALFECDGRDVEEEATESAFEAVLELRKRLRELGGDNEVSEVGGSGGFNHVRMVRRASSRLGHYEPNPGIR